VNAVNQDSAQDPVRALALLDEPNRRGLYEFVAASGGPVGRDEAAAAIGISRELAAFHLDRLVAAGLLETEYRRRSGRGGPGAGRPAKLYRRSDRELAVLLPARHYERAADLFAEGLERLGGTGAAVVADSARAAGTEAGLAARRGTGPHPSRRRLSAALQALLRDGGFEPEVDSGGGAVTLRNCPYRTLSADHRELTCGMNHAWAEGVVDGLKGSGFEATLSPAPGRCCVVFQER
jgi:predicted ArsR family transcriptional regulator